MEYHAKVYGPDAETAYRRAWAIIRPIQTANLECAVRAEGEYDGHGLPCVFTVPQALTEQHLAIRYIKDHC